MEGCSRPGTAQCGEDITVRVTGHDNNTRLRCVHGYLNLGRYLEGQFPLDGDVLRYLEVT